MNRGQTGSDTENAERQPSDQGRVHPAPSGKRKREGHRSSQTRDQPLSKRSRPSSSSCSVEEEPYQAAASGTNENTPDPLQYWILAGMWRKEYFEQDSQVREDFERGKSPEEFEQQDWLEEHYAREPFEPMPDSILFNIYTSDQLPRANKSFQYTNPGYAIRLEQKGSYMHESTLGITDTSKSLCRALLRKEQIVPQHTLFRDDLFDETCKSVDGRNEATVIRDISPLICPPAQVLRIFGAKHLNYLCESVNEGWNSAAEFLGTRPQPDYSVGFGLSAFTQGQMNKLKPFMGEPGFMLVTHFMATMWMYFSSMTCEVKCGAAALDIADRQNAQSMSIAVRALVKLFKLVGREKELDREILAFSISHDHTSVRIYGHYPVIEGHRTIFFRHPIHKFDFTALDGKEKWTTYKSVKNVYDHHSPNLHKKICSAINDLPADINFDLSQSASFSQSTPQSLQQSDVGSTLGGDESQPSFLGSEEITPTTSFTQTDERASKKPRNQRAAGL